MNDIINTGNDQDMLRRFIACTHSEFAIKDLDQLNYFLGLEISYTPHGLFIGKDNYAHDILERADLLDSKLIATPLVAGESLVLLLPSPKVIVLKKNISLSTANPFRDPTLYRSLVGALQYLTITRSDLSYAVNSVSQFLHSPTNDHFFAVKRILHYVKGTIHYGLSFTRRPEKSIMGCSNADWARCIETRHSTFGYSIFLGENLFSWSVKK